MKWEKKIGKKKKEKRNGKNNEEGKETELINNT